MTGPDNQFVNNKIFPSFFKLRYGILLLGADSAIIKGNIIKGHEAGILVRAANNVIIQANTITDNSSEDELSGGIFLSADSDGTVIISNIVVENLPENIVDDGSSTNTLLADNTFDTQIRSPTPAPTPPPTLKPTPAPTPSPIPL